MAQIVTITNPLTGQPAQVDQLDHTAQQIDDAIARALPGGYYDKWVSQLPGQNLLDNWYFGNPVDQRGGRVVKPNTTYYSDNTLTTSSGTTSGYVTAYRYATGTANGVNYASFKLEDTDTAPTYYAAPENVVRGYTGSGYGIDRWALGPSQTLLIRDNHIALSTNDGGNWLTQKIEHHTKYVGSTLTASALITAESAGTMRFMFSDAETQGGWGDSGWSQVDFSENETKLITFTRKVERGMAGLIFQPITAGVWFDIHAAKLELGSQQTLAHQENGVWQLNEIPNYGEQLARCQRYHFEFGPSHALIAYDGYGVNSPVVYFPVQMRTVSAIKVYSKAGTENAITYWNGSAEVDFTDFYLEWNENFVVLRSNGKFTQGGIYTVGKLIAYADL